MKHRKTIDGIGITCDLTGVKKLVKKLSVSSITQWTTVKTLSILL